MKYKSVKGLLKSDESLIPVTFIDKLEDVLHGFLGILLFIVSILAAGYSLQRLIETRPFFPVGMIQGINDILFVVFSRNHAYCDCEIYRWCFSIG